MDFNKVMEIEQILAGLSWTAGDDIYIFTTALAFSSKTGGFTDTIL